MIMTPEGYESVKDVERVVSQAVAETLMVSEYRVPEVYGVSLGHRMVWHSYAVRTYLAQAVQHLGLTVFGLHPTEGPCKLDIGPSGVHLPGDEIWAVGRTEGGNALGFSNMFRSSLWIGAFTDQMLAGTEAPRDPAWTMGSTPEGFPTLFREADARRLLKTVAVEPPAKGGRPRKRDAAVEKYRDLFPRGHEAAGIPYWDKAAEMCGVSVKTLKRGLQEALGAK